MLTNSILFVEVSITFVWFKYYEFSEKGISHFHNCNNIQIVVIFCSQRFTDITTEENNFLVVIIGLTKIVYPVVKTYFNAEVPADVLDKIRQNIYDSECNSSRKRGNGSQKKRAHLSEKQRNQLFSPKR